MYILTRESYSPAVQYMCNLHMHICLQKSTEPQPQFDHLLQSDLSTPSKPDDKPTPCQEQQKRQFAEFLRLLGLTSKFPRKLKISDAMIIRQETLGNTDETEDGNVLPHLILQKLMMCDSRSRGSLFKGTAQPWQI